MDKGVLSYSFIVFSSGVVMKDKKVMLILIVIEAFVVVGIFLYPNNIMRLIAMIVGVIGLVKLYVISINSTKNMFTYILIIGIYQFFILTELVDDYQIVNGLNWKYAILLSLIYVGTIMLIGNKNKVKKPVIIYVIVLLISYISCVSTISIANVELDYKEKKLAAVLVEDKAYTCTQIYIIDTQYEFLAKGPVMNKECWINVPYSLYKTISINDELDVYEGVGLFNMGYYHYKGTKYKEYVVDRNIFIDEKGEFYKYIEGQKLL